MLEIQAEQGEGIIGSGTWSTNTYAAATTLRSNTSTPDFEYHVKTRSQGRDQWKPHSDLDPMGVNRESRDSADHPTSLAISVLFDVTGSMLKIPQDLQKRLPELFEALLLNGYAVDPQLMMGAIGDATCDRVPLQVSQFESDNRIDDNIRNIFLEGGGGGSNHETYELGLYFMARHTMLDCVEKRDHRGYLFMIGDELAYDRVRANDVKRIIGDDIDGDIDIEYIIDEVLEKYELFFLIPEDASNGKDPAIRNFWTGLLGDHAIVLQSMDHISDLIATAVGVGEGNVTLDQAVAALVAEGKTTEAASVEAALKGVTFGAAPASTSPSSTPTTII